MMHVCAMKLQWVQFGVCVLQAQAAGARYLDGYYTRGLSMTLSYSVRQMRPRHHFLLCNVGDARPCLPTIKGRQGVIGTIQCCHTISASGTLSSRPATYFEYLTADKQYMLEVERCAKISVCDDYRDALTHYTTANSPTRLHAVEKLNRASDYPT